MPAIGALSNLGFIAGVIIAAHMRPVRKGNAGLGTVRREANVQVDGAARKNLSLEF
jgi:hypothetical protein